MITTAEVPATSSGQTKGSARKVGAAILPGNKAGKGKSKVWQESHLSHLSLFSRVAYALGRAVLMT
jgi:hypothetical protein